MQADRPARSRLSEVFMPGPLEQPLSLARLRLGRLSA